MKKPTRRGKVCCGCGSVVLDLTVPPSSYKYLEQTSIVCHCSDCIGFPDALFQSAKNVSSDAAEESSPTKKCIDVIDHQTNSVNHIFFYDSDITIVKGKDLIAWHKLTPKTDINRFYAKCCRTPLGFHPGESSKAHTIALYKPLITPIEDPGKNEIFFVPTPQVGVFRSCAPVGSASHDNVKMRKNGNAPVTLLRYIGRDTIGKIKHKNAKEGGIVVPSEEEIGVGLENLKQVP
uniref:Uncharacterized protein n=1 Tax=Helicotheca tamesis TaxID=374047 RepID=A0A7S2N0G0_9STRA|mmetsp:Transcript_6966/g.9409  ORF Transcript_6966/g.9409 Transcript_6966/m.9409 type:complete len:234 (+) Transcript_6966:43-744(+)